MIRAFLKKWIRIQPIYPDPVAVAVKLVLLPIVVTTVLEVKSTMEARRNNAATPK